MISWNRLGKKSFCANHQAIYGHTQERFKFLRSCDPNTKQRLGRRRRWVSLLSTFTGFGEGLDAKGIDETTLKSVNLYLRQGAAGRYWPSHYCSARNSRFGDKSRYLGHCRSAQAITCNACQYTQAWILDGSPLISALISTRGVDLICQLDLTATNADNMPALSWCVCVIPAASSISVKPLSCSCENYGRAWLGHSRQPHEIFWDP
ncbi:MAG: hypothetical protein CM15mP115_12060 [Alphaproteobacteria bacterium]|nr:MAG: hypothetical protein CM15mP115_12060 [Alphaproteobacteria bacterium]